jgi:hypothetical protein
MTSFVKVIATLYSKAGGGRRYACSGRQVGMKIRLLALSLILVLRLEGLVCASGTFHFKGDGQGTTQE